MAGARAGQPDGDLLKPTRALASGDASLPRAQTRRRLPAPPSTAPATSQANAQLAEGSRAKAEALSSSEATLSIKRSQIESMHAALADARRHVAIHAAEAAQRTDDLCAAGEELDLRSEQLSLAHQQARSPPSPLHTTA